MLFTDVMQLQKAYGTKFVAFDIVDLNEGEEVNDKQTKAQKFLLEKNFIEICNQLFYGVKIMSQEEIESLNEDI